jgi:microcin C transport system permease protein
MSERLKKFCSLRRASISVWIFSSLTFFSLTSNFWANNKPLVMNVGGRFYAPIIQDVPPGDLGQPGVITDYRALQTEWAIWPLIRWSPNETNPNVSTFPSPPTKDNWFGTDDRGRDVFTRLLYGFRYTLLFAALVWFFSFLLGSLVGGVMGYFGGKIDLFGQRVVEVFDSIPYVLVMLTLLSLLGAQFPLLIAAAVILGWMRISLYMRAEFLKLRKRPFVEAGRAQGVRSFSLLSRHILPNALTPLITFSPTEIAMNIYLLTMLDYLGLGLPPPTPSWGELLQQANSSFTIAWWLALYPSLSMILVLTTLTFIGDGVRHAFAQR